MTTGFSTPSADLDLIKIGEARKSLVGVKLDQVSTESFVIFIRTKLELQRDCVFAVLFITNSITPVLAQYICYMY